jgi:hypothetical protein
MVAVEKTAIQKNGSILFFNFYVLIKMLNFSPQPGLVKRLVTEISPFQWEHDTE